MFPHWLQAQQEEEYIEDEQLEEGTPYEEGYEEAQSIVPVNPTATTGAQKYRSEKINVRPFDTTAWRKTVGSTDFSEKPEEEKKREAAPGPRPSLPWGGEVMKLIAYLLIGGLVAFIVYQVIKNTSVDNKVVRSTPTAPTAATPVEDIETADLETWLAQARTQGNWREAVRVHYLLLLRALHTAGKIRWQKDKTNLEYLNELLAHNLLYDPVRHLTRMYERVWYGEHTLTQPELEHLAGDFEQVNQALKDTSRS
ncbi:MAG: DUF4129 domain-containing protein [Bacteroidota bacterium]